MIRPSFRILAKIGVSRIPIRMYNPTLIRTKLLRKGMR